jgi:anti-repressor protein
MNNLVTNKNVRGYIDEKGTAYLNLEDVARGLGFEKTEMKNGKEYKSIRWATIKKYLEEIGFDNKLSKDLKVNHTSVENDFIPENVFYKLCMKANNEVARKFQDLVCDEILPSIRKNGGYIVENQDDTDEDIMAKALMIAQRTIEKRNQRIQQLEIKIEENKPKVMFAEAVTASKDSILIRELAKTLKQNGYDTGEKRMFAWLREQGYLIKKEGADYNLPTQRAMDLGLFEIKKTAINHSNGEIEIKKTPKITGKGQIYFINKLINKIA